MWKHEGIVGKLSVDCIMLCARFNKSHKSCEVKSKEKINEN